MNQDKIILTSVTSNLNDPSYIMSPLDALDKLDHTLCLNNLKFGIDEDDHIDCKDVYEMLKCIDIIRKALIDLIPQHNKIYLNSPYFKDDDPCEMCPYKNGFKDALGRPVVGDSPCQWCQYYKWKVTW